MPNLGGCRKEGGCQYLHNFVEAPLGLVEVIELVWFAESHEPVQLSVQELLDRLLEPVGGLISI
jgi:hypothetical protein